MTMFHFNSFLLKLFPKDIEAVALFGHCFFRHSKQKTPPHLINHEMIHIYQMRKAGYLRFYFTYIADYVKLRFKGYSHSGAYLNIPYEVEAYQNERDLQHIRRKYAEYV